MMITRLAQRICLFIISIYTIGHAAVEMPEFEFPSKKPRPQFINCVIKNYAIDIFALARNTISTDTVVVAGVFIPAYFIARHFDTRIHNCFYCPEHHRNTHECHTFDVACGSDILFGMVLVALSIPAFVSHHECMQTTSRIFAETIPFLLLMKKALKQLRINECIRPFCQWFPKRTTYSGFPSGHLMTWVYIATLFGSQLGPWWSVPFGLWAGITFVDFIASNRHYASQMIAGAGLGLAFGLAASKVVDEYCLGCKNNIKFKIAPTRDGGVSCGISCAY